MCDLHVRQFDIEDNCLGWFSVVCMDGRQKRCYDYYMSGRAEL